MFLDFLEIPVLFIVWALWGSPRCHKASFMIVAHCHLLLLWAPRSLLPIFTVLLYIVKAQVWFVQGPSPISRKGNTQFWQYILLFKFLSSYLQYWAATANQWPVSLFFMCLSCFLSVLHWKNYKYIQKNNHWCNSSGSFGNALWEGQNMSGDCGWWCHFQAGETQLWTSGSCFYAYFFLYHMSGYVLKYLIL